VAPLETPFAGLVLAIFGPTASGKSAVAEAVARRIPAEIVSADSMQVYHGLPVLTNQPAAPTRLTAIWDLDHEASVGEYAALAHEAVDEILAAGKTPVVTGGTGLYLRAALAELGLPPPPAPGERERFERLYDERGPESAHALLGEQDPAAAAAVHPNDRRRVVRALELAQAGASLAPNESRLWTEDTRHPTLLFGLDVPKGVLEARIVKRTRAMFESGVEGEVARAEGSALSGTVRQVIGLREVTGLPREAAIAAISQRTIQYAAYQRKWVRRVPGLIPIEADRPVDAVAQELLETAARGIPLSGQQEPASTGMKEGKADTTGHAV
jgi:tRNA dimethylallyltransferase